MSDTCSRFSSAGGEAVGEALRLEGKGGDAVGEVLRLEGKDGNEDGGDATPDRGERWNTSSSSCPRSNSNSFRLLLVLLAGGEMTSGDGGGEAGCCGLDGVGDTASEVGVQGFLPAGVATAGAAVATEGGGEGLMPKVGAALPRRGQRRRRRR